MEPTYHIGADPLERTLDDCIKSRRGSFRVTADQPLALFNYLGELLRRLNELGGCVTHGNVLNTAAGLRAYVRFEMSS